MRGRTFRRGAGWAYQVDLGPDPATGRRRQKLKGGFPTRKAADAALAALLTEVTTGAYVEPTRQSVEDFLEAWLANVAPALRPSTVSGYTHAVRSWVVPHIGRLRVSEVTPAVLQKLYADLATKGGKTGRPLGAGSIKQAHQVLRMALDQAAAWRLIPSNPAAVKLHRLRQGKPPLKSWSPEEALQFLQANKDERLAPLWGVMLATGLRRSEALGLRWDAVDLAAGRLRVVQTVVVVRGKALVSEPKTDAARRVVELEPAVVRLLDHWRRRQIEERLAAGPAWVGSGLVFTTALGGLLHPEVASRAFEKACQRAGVPRLTPHGLRHTAATLALARGVHPKLVQEMLGHSNIAITLDIYSHTTRAMHKDAAAAIAGLLFPAEPPALLPAEEDPAEEG